MNEIPQNPTLLWCLTVAITALSGVVVYLFKSNETKNKEGIKNLLLHKSEVTQLLEKTLSAFNEVERKIVDTDNNSRSELKDTIVTSQKEIVGEMEKIVSKNG